MLKKDFIKWVYWGLLVGLLSFATAGCGDGGGGGPVATNGGGGGGGGGVSGTVGGTPGGGPATTATGLGTGTGTTSGFGGGGGGGTTAGGTTGGTTTGGTTGGTTAGNFNDAVSTQPLYNGVTNPTQFAQIGGRIYFAAGYQQGTSNGAIFSFDLAEALANPANTPALTRLRNLAGTRVEGDSFTNPWGLVAFAGNLIITEGMSTGVGGGLTRISNIAADGTTGDFDDLATDAAAGLIQNPAFVTVANTDGNTWVYWSEYAAPPFGRVRRTPLNGVGDTQNIFEGLTFPAGIAHDGTDLVVLNSLGGNGQVLRTSLSFAGTALTDTSPGVTIVQPATGEQAFARPFDIVYDGTNGFFFTEGNAIEGVTGIAGTSVGNGAVRYLASGSSTARLVANGLNQAAGIAAAPLSPNTAVGIAYTESLPNNGRVRRQVVDTTNPTRNTSPDEVDIGLDRPIDVLINSSSLPRFLVLENYNGGVANGGVNAYAP